MNTLEKDSQQEEGLEDKQQKIDQIIKLALPNNEDFSSTKKQLIAFAKLEEWGIEVPTGIKLNLIRQLWQEELNSLPLEEREKRRKQLLKEFGSEEKIIKAGLKKYILLGIGGLLIGLGAGYWTGANVAKRENSRKIKYEPRQDSIKTEIITFEKSIDTATYEKLSKNGKIVYDFVRENNPTPNKSYVIVDKPNAKLYLIGPDNILIADSSIVIGTDLGEEKNTSVEFKKGIRTTPSGVYVMAKKIGLEKKDAMLYKGNSFILFGISANGEKSHLGWHQIYSNPNDSKNEEFNRRIKAFEKMANKTGKNSRTDMALSDGCINSPKIFFEKYAIPNINGDGFELMYVLPDSIGSEAPPVLELGSLKKIIEEIKPTMLEIQKIEQNLKDK